MEAVLKEWRGRKPESMVVGWKRAVIVLDCAGTSILLDEMYRTANITTI